MNLQEINKKLNEVSNELSNIKGASFPREIYNDENLCFFLSMVHLHDTDYETFVLISKYVLASLKEKQIDKMIEIKELKKIIEQRKNNGYDENKLSFENYKLQTHYSELEQIKEGIKNFRIFPKDEEIIKPEQKNLVDSFMKMQFAKLDFEDNLNPERNRNIDILKAEIMADKLKMEAFIKEYE